MSESIDRFLKQQERLQKLMSQVYNPSTNRVVSQMDILSKLRRDVTTINPILEMIHDQNSLVNQISSISKWNSNISRFLNSQYLNLDDVIPDTFYDSLDDLLNLVEPSSYYHTSHDDISVEITVKEKDSILERKLTWADYFQIIFMLITFAYGLYDNHVTTDQFTELMGEIQKQTEISEHTNILLERNNELLEKDIEVQEQNTDIQERILHEMQSNNITEEEKVKIHHAIEGKVDQILESINNFTDSPIDSSDSPDS